MPRTTRITIALLFAAWVVDYIDRTVINFALPSIGADLDLDHAQQGLLVSVFFIAYAAAQVPGGLLADRYGALRVAMVGLLAWSVFTGLTAIAWSFSVLLAMRFLFGLVQGVFPTAALKALAERSLPDQRTTATGWVNTSNAAGLLFAALIAGALLPTLGWRAMFAIISVLGVAIIVAWRRWMPEPLPQHLIPAEAVRPPAERRAVLFSPALVGFAFIFFGYDVLVWGVTAWTPTYLHEEHGISMTAIALSAVPTTLAAATGVMIGARISDRLGGRPAVIVVPAMAFTAVMLLILPHLSFPFFVLVGTVMSFVAGLGYMPAFAVPLRALPSAYMGAASAVIIFGGQLAGVISPLVFGIVVDHFSYTAAFAVTAIGPLLAVAASTLVPQTAEAFWASVSARTPSPVPSKEVL
ncbi:MFS transporter [Nocardia jejuensis]|uniref:MFS transporter n=1 Tax=Nocardia jejuensis TaxID=328049 RepID=UPI00082D6F66|nr:MFS transporter [Nocardia jejuensis]